MRLKTVRFIFLNPMTGMVYFAFPQPVFPNPCDLSEICVSFMEQPLEVWYVWVFLIILLIVMLRCMVGCCLQCWIKRQTRFLSRRMVTVVTLSSPESVHVAESSQCHRPHLWVPHQNIMTSTSGISLRGLESGAPPSYEELFNISTSKF
ncbi:transmembrane protein 207 [Pelobates fuscus]|uniref:transmembrane protein 207 n=1 Tax=Pelobates fuscus TaxID=191477 RepID=UPI002FE4F5D3